LKTYAVSFGQWLRSDLHLTKAYQYILNCWWWKLSLFIQHFKNPNTTKHRFAEVLLRKQYRLHLIFMQGIRTVLPKGPENQFSDTPYL